ncbi:apolipoprotein N-acyltransferase [Marinifilum sp. JC120]|nr:apolipoprotein N-acyltransferase [Marinifilum sp. JC120]
MLSPVAAFLLGFFLPFEQYQWLTLVAFVPLALVLRGAGGVSGFLAGLLFGAIFWGTGTWWLLNSMDSMLHLSPVEGFGASALFWGYQALPFAVFGCICGWLNRRGYVAGPFFCASLFTLLVFLRPVLCPASCVLSVALWPEFIQVADFGGEYLVFFFWVLLNWLLAEVFVALRLGNVRRAFFWAVTFTVLLGGVLAYGELKLNEYGVNAEIPVNRTLKVASVQPNVPVRWGTDDAPISAFATDEEMCARTLTEYMDIVKGGDLIVFPELPRLNCAGNEFAASGLNSELQNLGIPALIPSDEYRYASESKQNLLEDDKQRQVTSQEILAKYNSVFVFRPGKGVIPVYRKVRLVPFSEATPLRDFSFVQGMLWQGIEVTQGDGPRLISVQGLEVQPLICFETGFSGLVRQGVALGADLLVEVSNDGWFASRDAEMKHLGMGIFRTIEFRRPLVRCSNSGSGVFVRASGELDYATLTEQNSSVVISAEVFSPEVRTVYAKWGKLWIWFTVLVVLWRLSRVVLRSYF